MNRFSFPTSIYFGDKSTLTIPEYLKENKMLRPLIVTDSTLVNLPVFRNFLKLILSSGINAEVYSEVIGNPVKSQVVSGVNAFQKLHCDSLIGFGGGAALDVTKAIALMVNHPGDLFDYEDGKAGALPIIYHIPSWIAIPTTAGTGSEVGRSSVISDDVTHIKKIIFDPKLMAKAVFADPEVTLDLPPTITAYTGMDALTHCIEAYLSKGFHPICDGIALEGLRLAGLNLELAVKNPQNLAARGGMLMASMMGAIAFQKGLGVTHSCAHALGTVANMHHGLANAILIDHALAFNLNIVPERFERMAIALDLKNPSGMGFIDWLKNLKEKINIPSHLTHAGLNRDLLPRLVEVAYSDSCHASNPGPVSLGDFGKIFNHAFA
jgi:alcohol dehydrogenase class IV